MKKQNRSTATKRLLMAWALIRWDIAELFGRSSYRAQRRVIELTFELETDPAVFKAVAQEASQYRKASQ